MQIDPTISHLLDSETHVSGSYVTQAKPTKSNVQREYMRIGYCPADDLETRIFVQFKNLPQLPENSIVCAAKCYFGVADFAHHDYASMSVLLREITGEHAWGTPFTWNEQPSVSEKTGDYQKIKLDSEGGYTGWNITELVKDHYLAGNGTGLVSGFGLYTHDVKNMDADDWANAVLCMNWQYASMAVVPKKTQNQEGTIKIVSAVVRVCYYNNANFAYFDNISLTEEPAQTYVYDEKGNLTSVKAAGNGKEDYKYEDSTENLLEVVTPGSGKYTYKYENENNKYLPTTVANAGVSMNIAYNESGEATGTTLVNTTDDVQMISTAEYENGLLKKQTDNTGAETLNVYNEDRDCISNKNANGQEIKTKKETTWGYADSVWQTGQVSAAYGYSNGNLSTITRGGYQKQGNSDNGKKYNQIYGFEHDEFGNRTKVTLKGEVVNKSDGSIESSSDTVILAAYSYLPNNGPLSRMAYGTLEEAASTVDYTYDKLERVKTVTYTDTDPETNAVTGTVYGYDYSSGGSLAGITVNGNAAYDYTYDSLGRLIYSAKLQNRRPVLCTFHEYDTSNRLREQSWQIGNESFSESYTYSEEDGRLTGMETGGEALEYSYYNSKQLFKRPLQKRI